MYTEIRDNYSWGAIFPLLIIPEGVIWLNWFLRGKVHRSLLNTGCMLIKWNSPMYIEVLLLFYPLNVGIKQYYSWWCKIMTTNLWNVCDRCLLHFEFLATRHFSRSQIVRVYRYRDCSYLVSLARPSLRVFILKELNTAECEGLASETSSYCTAL